MAFDPGRQVKITGLQAKPELNDKVLLVYLL